MAVAVVVNTNPLVEARQEVHLNEPVPMSVLHHSVEKPYKQLCSMIVVFNPRLKYRRLVGVETLYSGSSKPHELPG